MRNARWEALVTNSKKTLWAPHSASFFLRYLYFQGFLKVISPGYKWRKKCISEDNDLNDKKRPWPIPFSGSSQLRLEESRDLFWLATSELYLAGCQWWTRLDCLIVSEEFKSRWGGLAVYSRCWAVLFTTARSSTALCKDYTLNRFAVVSY